MWARCSTRSSRLSSSGDACAEESCIRLRRCRSKGSSTGFSEVGGFTDTDARRPGCVTRATPTAVSPPSLGHLQCHRGDDDAVVIGVNVLARAEGNATEGHRHVTVTDAALFGLHRVAGQSLNTQSSLDQNIYITHTAVDDDALPAIIGRLLCQDRKST